MSSEAEQQQQQAVVIAAQGLGKMYQLYSRPQDRLAQAFLWGRRKLYREFWALRDVSFEIRRGEVVGVIGRNGSGKSTLLQILAGVLQPSAGRAEVRGRIAAMLELGSGFNPEFSGRENIHINGTILGLTRRQIEERFDAIVDFAEIRPFIDQPVKTYSSGMYMRLAFAISVHVDADVLVVDEALSVGDAAFQFKCLHHLEELLSRGVTVLLVSHDVQLVKSYCTRAIFLKGGSIAYVGDCETATDLYNLDMRAANRAQWDAPAGRKWTPEEGTSADVPVEKGRIIQVKIGSGEEERITFEAGERVWVDVTAQVDRSVRHPRLTMVVRDLKGYNLFSFSNLQAAQPLTPDANGMVRGRFSFTCRLQSSDYAVRLRLDNCPTEKLVEPLSRQATFVRFQVQAKQKRFNGAIDLGGEFEPLEATGLAGHMSASLASANGSACEANVEPCRIMLNSLPKSGTNLVKRALQLLMGCSETHIHIGRATIEKYRMNGDGGGASVPVGVEEPQPASLAALAEALKAIRPGHYATGHLPYSAPLAELLASLHFRSLLVLRDPRDVVVSHAEYVAATREHPLHDCFAQLSPEQRILASIQGTEPCPQKQIPRALGIRQRVECLLPWMQCPHTYVTRFEKLVGERGGGSRQEQVRELCKVAQHLRLEPAEQQIAAAAEQMFGQTMTFRKGMIGDWRNHFTPQITRAFKDAVGELLVELGYEDGPDW